VSAVTAIVAAVRGLYATSLYRETDAETGWLGDQDAHHATISPLIPCFFRPPKVAWVRIVGVFV
jgi:hypothetical protein